MYIKRHTIRAPNNTQFMQQHFMKLVRWNTEKAREIKEKRGIDFDKIALMIEENQLLGIMKVPSRNEQNMFLLNYEDYLVCAPFVETEDEIFLKTAYKNRKLNKTVSSEKIKNKQRGES